MADFGLQAITWSPPKVPGQVTNKGIEESEDPMKEFLQLLVAQIGNQTPDDPMDATQMITQYAQINAAIGMSHLNQASQANQKSAIAAGLIGKDVVVSNIQQGLFERGQVTAVDYSGKTPMVKIGDTYYSLDDVTHVSQPG
ncbi:Basal-body rod modification protein FlgD [compost metagenome]